MCAGRFEWMAWRFGESGYTGDFGVPVENHNGRRMVDGGME